MARSVHASDSAPENIHEMLAVWGREIAEARIRFGLTESDFSTCLFVSPSTITRLERGDPSVSLGIFVNALWALGLNERLDAEFVSIEEVFCVPGEVVDCVPEAILPSNENTEATMSQETPFGPMLISKTAGKLSEPVGLWGPFPQNNPVQKIQTKIQDINRATLQSGVDQIERIKDNLSTGTRDTLVKLARSGTGQDIQHVDLRYFRARFVDLIKSLFMISADKSQDVRKLETRRERRRRIICRAVSQARHLNGANANVPPPTCIAKTR